jgi:ATP-dependent Clp protease ATP-binding subunit ClpC
MTSNIGAGAIAKNTTLGFSVGEDETGVSYDDMKNRIMGELKKVFRPELLNRIDEVIVFHKLSKDEIKQIVDQLMKRLREQMKVHEVSIELTDSAKEFMVDKGYDPTMGARPLRRAIQRWIEDPLADFVLARNLRPGSTVLVDHQEGDEEVVLQLIDPVDVPDAPPADLVPAEGPASERDGDDTTGEHDSPAE